MIRRTVIDGGVGVRTLTTHQAVNRGYSEGRRAYDRRRRMNARSGATVSYIEVLRGDPCGLCFDGQECHEQIAADHTVPLEQGGSDSWENMGAGCRRHNAAKGNKSLLDYLLEART